MGQKINLEGCFTPFLEGHPLTMKMPGVRERFVVVFDTLQKLDAEMQFLNVRGYKPHTIDDTDEFVDSVMEGGARLMYNPVRCEKTTKWTEITNIYLSPLT